MKQVLIAATGSGSGKTLITCALLQALKNRGLNPHAFKCGPDYIDPMFHRTVLNVPSNNLDLFFVNDDKLREIYAENIQDSDIAIIEGVMGLYDGISVTSEEGSAYHIASVLNIPIILVADAKGCGRSIISQLKGFIDYDKNKLIAGVFLNRISERFYESIMPVIEKELAIPVLGYLPNDPLCTIESRHLGLKLPGELPMLKEQISVAADTLDKNESVDNIINAVPDTPRLTLNVSDNSKSVVIDSAHKVNIGIAQDEAFCFYYEENFNMLEKHGVRLVFFSPLHDSELPDGLDAIILGGGYPEIYANELAGNISMKLSIKDAVLNGMPSVAECGGFMYLHETLRNADGNEYEMCGVIPGSCFYTGKLVRFGYVNVKEKRQNFMNANDLIKGHEFHYYDSDNNGYDCIASKPLTNKKWDCIYDVENHFWGFSHLYYPSNPDFVVKFIEMARNYHEQKYS